MPLYEFKTGLIEREVGNPIAVLRIKAYNRGSAQQQYDWLRRNWSAEVYKNLASHGAEVVR